MNDAQQSPENKVPDTYDELVSYIKHESECPLPTKVGEKYHCLRYKLIGLWRDTVSKYSVYEESFFIYEEEEDQDFELNEYTQEELRPIAVNIAENIPKARKDFLKITAPLQAVVADEKVYAKHLLRLPIPIKNISSLAVKNNCSYLFCEITPNVIDDMILKGAQEFMEAIVNTRKIRFSVICDDNIGVTDKGIMTNCLMVEINEKIAHAYPCSLNEAKNNVQQYTLKNRDRFDANCFLDDENDDIDQTFKLSTDYSIKSNTNTTDSTSNDS